MPALLAVLVLLLLPADASAQAPPGAQHHEATIAAPDGTQLAADVFLPADLAPRGRVPVVLDAGPYFGRFGQPAPSPAPPDVYVRQRLFERGYGLVDLSLRGFGGSGGCLSFHGAADRADMRAAVAWVGKQPWSSGRVAVAGFSYDGGAALNALASAGDLVDAAVLLSPVAAPYESLWSQGVHHLQPFPFANIFGPGLAGVDASGPTTGGSPDREAANALAVDPACWARHMAGVEQDDPEHPFWRERRPATAAAGTRVPVLTSFGFEETTSRIPAYLRTFRGPLRAWLGQWDHVPANDQDIYPQDDLIGREGFQAELDAFLDHHLQGRGRAPRSGFVVQEGAGGFRSEASWPPADARTLRLPVLAGAFRDAPGNTADGRDVLTVGAPAGSASIAVPSPGQGRGSWTFTPPLRRARHLAGEPVVRVDTARDARGGQVVALLYDVDEQRRATFVTRGAAVIAVDGVTVRLLAQDWRFRPGHRIGLLLTAADDSTYRPGRTLREVVVGGGELRLPVLRARRVDDLSGGPNRFHELRRPFEVDAAVVTDRTARAAR